MLKGASQSMSLCLSLSFLSLLSYSLGGWESVTRAGTLYKLLTVPLEVASNPTQSPAALYTMGSTQNQTSLLVVGKVQKIQKMTESDIFPIQLRSKLRHVKCAQHTTRLCFLYPACRFIRGIFTLTRLPLQSFSLIESPSKPG